MERDKSSKFYSRWLLSVVLPMLLPLQAGAAPALVDPPTWLPPAGRVVLRVAGGVPPFTWQTGAGQIEELAEREFRYTAPGRYMVDQLRLWDKLGETVEFPVSVYRPLQLSPSVRYLKQAESEVAYTIIGGSGEWQWLANDMVAGKIDGNRLVVSLPEEERQALEQSELLKVGVVDQVTGEQAEVELHLVLPVVVTAVEEGDQNRTR